MSPVASGRETGTGERPLLEIPGEDVLHTREGQSYKALAEENMAGMLVYVINTLLLIRNKHSFLFDTGTLFGTTWPLMPPTGVPRS